MFDPSVAFAVITAIPLEIAVTFPFWSTVATPILLLDHTRVLLLARSGSTVAVSVEDSPSFNVISDSLRIMLETGFTTLTIHDAEMFEPSVALTVITAVPLDLAVTLPSCVTVATALLLEDQASVLLLASEETIAVSCADCPSLRVISVSFKTIPETNLTTFTVQDAETFEPSVDFAVITAVPLDIAVTFPFWLTVATVSSLLVHERVLLFARSGVTVAVS